MSVKQLMALNNLKTSKLHNGQVLAVSGGASEKTKIAKAPTGKAPGAKVANAKIKSHYTVKRGETLAGIAKKHNVDASDLQRWNNLNGKQTLVPGRTLVIYKEDA